MEKRFYVIDLDVSNLNVTIATEEEIKDEAEKLGTVYSQEGFERAFNRQEINSSIDFLMIAEV